MNIYSNHILASSILKALPFQAQARIWIKILIVFATLICLCANVVIYIFLIAQVYASCSPCVTQLASRRFLCTCTASREKTLYVAPVNFTGKPINEHKQPSQWAPSLRLCVNSLVVLFYRCGQTVKSTLTAWWKSNGSLFLVLFVLGFFPHCSLLEWRHVF